MKQLLLICAVVALVGCASTPNSPEALDADEKAYNEARYADAIRLFSVELAKEEAKLKSDWKWLAYYNNQLGKVHSSAGPYDKAMEFH